VLDMLASDVVPSLPSEPVLADDASSLSTGPNASAPPDGVVSAHAIASASARKLRVRTMG
jgi:hypothetical protein